jgi:hypothetical protein
MVLNYDLENQSLKSYSMSSVKHSQKTRIASISYNNTTNSTGEVIPWGVSAVWQGEDISQRGNFASDSYAFVIDSGVSDLTGDINLAPNNWHRSWISGESPFSDINGHGTHIAGTIGALVNEKGIVGVAPGAQIVSLKVINNDGFSDDLTAIDAINYAVSTINDNNLDKTKVVINLSMSGIFSSRLDDAIKNAANQGIRFSISAGNNGKDVDGYTPPSAGDHPNVFTVSAVDNGYKMPFWSNWDRTDSGDSVDDVDFSAPGLGILSYKNGELATMSGTSMASAHIAGLLITGGVQAGNYVIPNYSDTSDPFAITSTKAFVPSGNSSSPQQPYTAPEPTYSLISNTSISEGQILSVSVSTTNVRPGSYVYWNISGSGIDMKDFSYLSNLSGSSQVNNYGQVIINITLQNDNVTEGNEVIKFELFDQAHPSIRNTVGEAFITIQDTSKTPVSIVPQLLWGTLGDDIISGGDSTDRISGVLSSGTTKESMGFGQIDILTGGLGADVFLLGDNRGVFYDDKIKANLGTKDYARIKDFKSGEDKLQLKKGNSYIFNTSDGNLSLYLDANRNRKLENFGVNQDELIAVLEGVSTLGNNDLIMVS